MNARHLLTAAIGTALWSVAQRVFAAEGVEVGEGLGTLTVVFLVVAALIFVSQVIPAIIMFGSMLVALFSPQRSRARKEKKADQTA